eukprot:2914039-Pyramimonas_sp.AAC.1
MSAAGDPEFNLSQGQSQKGGRAECERERKPWRGEERRREREGGWGGRDGEGGEDGRRRGR